MNLTPPAVTWACALAWSVRAAFARLDGNACLHHYNGDVPGTLDIQRWVACSWSVVKRMLPEFRQIERRHTTSESWNEGTPIAECQRRHITIVRYKTPAASLLWLKTLNDSRFTIYDHRGDGFAAAFGPATNGAVVEQPNQCDEATGYLARIVDAYYELNDIEVFAHENDLVSTAAGKQLLSLTKERGSSNSGMAYLPMHQEYMTVGTHWGAKPLEYVLRRWYAWMLLNSDKPYEGEWSTQCCGSFATTRLQIHQLPLMLWKHLRSVTSNPLLSINGSHHYPPPSRRRYCFYGHVIERMWGVFLGQKPKGQNYTQLLSSWGAHKGRTVSKFVSCRTRSAALSRTSPTRPGTAPYR